jgi:hypothetical protein
MGERRGGGGNVLTKYIYIYTYYMQTAAVRRT